MQIRKRFVARVWNSRSPEAGRRRERRRFPKDMLQPRPDREKWPDGPASRVTESAGWAAPSQRVGTDHCTDTGQRRLWLRHIPFSRHYTIWALQQMPKSHLGQCRLSRKIPGGREARQFGGTPTDASCSGRQQPSWWSIMSTDNQTSGKHIQWLHLGTSPSPPSKDTSSNLSLSQYPFPVLICSV